MAADAGDAADMIVFVGSPPQFLKSEGIDRSWRKAYV
jgi:hypothetical protein